MLHSRKQAVLYLRKFIKNNIAEYLHYILGVNKNTSNLAVLSETGRFPMYFSITLSIVKFVHRLENTSNALLKEAYCLFKALHYKGIHTWLTSAIYILQLLSVNITSCRNLSENQLVCMIKKFLIKGFNTFWYKQGEKNSNIHTSVLKRNSLLSHI